MIAWPVAKIESEKRRLEVLGYLTIQPNYEAAASVLRLHCREIGVPTTADQVNGCIQWLEEQELITVRHPASEAIARVTVRGRDVSNGETIHPGVMRPDP